MAVSLTDTEYEALKRLASWDGLKRLDALLANIRRQPNFFLVAPRMLRVEGVHSDILAWLLDPQGWHGLGDKFGRRLLSKVLADCGEPTSPPVTVVEVHREFSTGNGPIDLLILARQDGADLVIGIENKVDSPEGSRQLARYAEGLSNRFPKSHLVLVFLTPFGEQPEELPNCRFATVLYRDVAKHLNAAVNEASDSANEPGLSLAQHYAAALRSHIMTESDPEIDEICRQLYDEHQEAWRAIRRRLPSKRDESHQYLGAKVAERLGSRYGGAWHFVVRQDRYACLFRQAWSSLGTYEADEMIGLRHDPQDPRPLPRVHFRLVVDTTESDAEERTHYRVRLKVDTAKNSLLGEKLVRALGAVDSVRPKLPARSQFTVSLKSTSQLPPVGDDPQDVPDSVVDWFAHQTAELVPVLDSVFKP